MIKMVLKLLFFDAKLQKSPKRPFIGTKYLVTILVCNTLEFIDLFCAEAKSGIFLQKKFFRSSFFAKSWLHVW